MYQIEKDIPIPQGGKQKSGLTQVLRELAIMESLLVPQAQERSISAICSRLKKDTGMTYTTRKTNAGVRVWRIE